MRDRSHPLELLRPGLPAADRPCQPHRKRIRGRGPRASPRRRSM